MMEFKSSKANVLNHKRTPAEESYYESYLLQKNSDVGNLYASNIYEGQCFQKTIKHINRERTVQAAEMGREMKKVQKKIDDLKQKSKKERLVRQRMDSDGSRTERQEQPNFAQRNSLTLPRTLPSLDTKYHHKHGSSSKPFSRALSELSIASVESESLSRSSQSLDCLLGPRTPSLRIDCDDDDDIFGANEQETTGPIVFVTRLDAKATEIKSPLNQRHLYAKKQTSMDSLGTNAGSLTPKLTRMRSHTMRAAKSQGDLTSLSDTTPFAFDKRTRTKTITKDDEFDFGESYDSVHMRYVAKEDRVKSASCFPKI
eukprot:Seg3257.3 transcript_id=Seg3257.3/GoldUCD/mRNA.D3Y31 product="hypothetical protein" protein_id=Seg3257.3/GoldUCD/D3Y31